MSLVSAHRVIRFGFQNLIRNFWISVATVSVLLLALISVNALITVNVLGNVALSLAKSKVDVSVHFKPDIDEARVQTVKITLLGLPEVKDVAYVSPEASLQNFSKLYERDQLVIQSLGEVGQNPFGSTLVIKARSIEGYPKIMAALEEPVFADLIEEKDFDDRQQMIGRVESVADRVEAFVMGVSALFGIIALLIVWNTIRMSIYTHRDEIRIMRLVGASDGFIRGPFYVEALLWSLLAVGIGIAIIYPTVGFAQPFLQNFFGSDQVDLLNFYRANFSRLFGLQLLGAVVLALFTTRLATGKYLKV